MLCELKTIGVTDSIYHAICTRCGRMIDVPFDPSTIKRVCEASTNGLIRYAVWHGFVRGWEFTWLKPGMDLEPDKYEECPMDFSQVGTKLAALISLAGYEVDMSACYCKALQAQLDSANLGLLIKYKDRVTELIHNSSKKAGIDVSKTKIKLAVWSVIKAEQVWLFVR